MKEPLFFHINMDPAVRPHTFCVRKTSIDGINLLSIGYALVHKNDHFCKKTGRETAEMKAKVVEGIDSKFFGTVPPIIEAKLFDKRLPKSINWTLKDIIERSGELLKISGLTKVRMLVGKKHRPVEFSYNIPKARPRDEDKSKVS